MLNMSLSIFFAHKKRSLVLLRTVEIPSPKDWEQKELTDSL